jgi:hypothetical protein
MTQANLDPYIIFGKPSSLSSTQCLAAFWLTDVKHTSNNRANNLYQQDHSHVPPLAAALILKVE